MVVAAEQGDVRRAVRYEPTARCEQAWCPGSTPQGGGLRDSFLVDGVAFKKTFSYAGFEMQPKSYDVRSGKGLAAGGRQK